MIACRDCLEPYPSESFPYLCPKCGGLFGFIDGLEYHSDQIEPDLPGIWRHRHSFGLPAGAPVITLGEGNTPLVWGDFMGKEIGYKMESLNPTGSFKDRGTAVLVSWLVINKIKEAVEDSSGNAGASFAAYAARSGIQGKIFIPSYASGPKRSQIESYGQQVIPVPGPRSKAAEAAIKETTKGSVYASHAYLPQGTAGMATVAYELVDQLQGPPGTLLLPVGHGSLLLGMAMGFEALYKEGSISRLPLIIGLQAQVCSPLYQAFSGGMEGPATIPENKTLAEGVAISTPYHGREVLKAVRESGGWFLAVKEEDIPEGQKKLAQQGIHAELTSALIWSGLEQLDLDVPDPVICVITGHGLKGAETVA
jgi:threonine synthase